MVFVNLIDTSLYNNISTYNSHYGKMGFSSTIKDSWEGHWELAGYSLADSTEYCGEIAPPLRTFAPPFAGESPRSAGAAPTI